MSSETNHNTHCDECGKGINADENAYLDWGTDSKGNGILCPDCKWKPVVTYDEDCDYDEDDTGKVTITASVELQFDGDTVKTVASGDWEETHARGHVKEMITDELVDELYSKLADYEHKCQLEAIKMTVDNYIERHKTAAGFLINWGRFGNNCYAIDQEHLELARAIKNTYWGKDESYEIWDAKKLAQNMKEANEGNYRWQKAFGSHQDQGGVTSVDGWMSEYIEHYWQNLQTAEVGDGRTSTANGSVRPQAR